jgi:hypothetical protein
VPGKLEGGVERTDIGGAWVSNVEEDADNVDLEHITVMVRIYKVKKKGRRGPGRNALDTTELEDLAEAIQTSIGAKAQGNALGPWFARVRAVEIDADDWGVQATITGWTANVGMPG